MRTILELHGSLKEVHCLKCETKLDRDVVQEELSRLNPEWWEYLHDNIRNGVSVSSTRAPQGWAWYL